MGSVGTDVGRRSSVTAGNAARRSVRQLRCAVPRLTPPFRQELGVEALGFLYAFDLYRHGVDGLLKLSKLLGDRLQLLLGPAAPASANPRGDDLAGRPQRHKRYHEGEQGLEQ